MISEADARDDQQGGVTTDLQITQALLDQMQAVAEQRIGGPCTPFKLDWLMWRTLEKLSPRPRQFGMDGGIPLRSWDFDDEGTTLLFGGAEYWVSVGAERLQVVQCRVPLRAHACPGTEIVWFCPTEAYHQLYRVLRKARKESEQTRPPLMTETLRTKLWDNTIGFLQKADLLWKQFQIPVRRGVMLLGDPGNGKTMAARWLRAEAEKLHYSWKIVTGEEYDRARAEGELNDLFNLYQPGIIFLDDFDRGLEDREKFGTRPDHAALLSVLDGMNTPEGVVYIFTSNLKFDQLDPAIRRPGRIDHFLTFERPNATLRSRFMQEYWSEPIRQAVPVEEAVRLTEGMSFAEIDELRKLMVLHFMDHDTWDWSAAWGQHRERMSSSQNRRPLGFATKSRPATHPVTHSQPHAEIVTS